MSAWAVVAAACLGPNAKPAAGSVRGFGRGVRPLPTGAAVSTIITAMAVMSEAAIQSL